MSKKFRLLTVLVLVTGLLGGLLTGSTVSADPVPGTVVELPRIDLGDVFGTGTADWDTKIQVQNVGVSDTGVIAFFWGCYDGLCPSNDLGLVGHACMYVPYNGVWTLHTQIPDDACSAIVYSVGDIDLDGDVDDDFQDACDDADLSSTADWKAWVADYGDTGEPLAVTVDRWGTDSYGEFEISSSYTGVSDPEMSEIGGAPYEYFAPYVMHGYNDLDTTITIQNSGDHCTSIWIYYKEEGNCEYMKAQHVEVIAPGQAIRIGPGDDADMAFPSPEIDPEWLGSAYITANEPLAVIVDQLSHDPSENRGTLLSMRGMPFWYNWNNTWYADLLYREISGWTSSIQVQNLTQDSHPTFVTVDFMDQSGDEILFVGDWVCRNGSATFYLPAIIDLGVNFPFGYVGAAEIESHYQVDYPGWGHVGEPIFAVVDLKKTKVYDASLSGWRHTVAGETQAGAYNAHPKYEKENAWGWAMPFIAKEQEGVTSRIAIRNNSNCNKIDGWIDIKDETGRVVTVIPVPWLQPKHMKVIDLAYFGQISRGFVGAAEFWVGGVEQLCDIDGDGEEDIEPVMPSVVVLNYGFAKELPIGGGAPQTTEGDLTRIYEGIPFAYGASPCEIEICGQVIEALDLEPLDDAEIWVIEGGTHTPYNISGTAYIGAACEGQIRLKGSTVQLQLLTDDGWSTVREGTTSSTGGYSWGDILEFGETYRLRIFVPVGQTNTVSYVSGTFVATGDVVASFHIETANGELVLDSGAWCTFGVDPDVVETLGDTTDSTGHYCFDWEKTAAPEDITLVAFKTGHINEPVTLSGVECDDLMVNFEMDPVCNTISVTGYVYDKMTGLGINGARVCARNDQTKGLGVCDDDTSSGGPQRKAGFYNIVDIPFDPGDTTKVFVSALGYNGEVDSVFIPKCGWAGIDFELHQTPKSRVLLYYGNGGWDVDDLQGLDGVNYDELADFFAGFGYFVDYTDVWPTEFDWTLKYELIVLLAPGHDNQDSLTINGFTWGQKADLDSYLQQEGKLVILSDATDWTGNGVENDLLGDLPVELDFAGGSYSSGHGDQIDPVSCLVNDVATYSAIGTGTNNWTEVNAPGTATPGEIILQNAGSNQNAGGAMYAADVPSHGNGWVAILGDVDGLSDNAWLGPFNWGADNGWIAFNWLFCDVP